MVNGALHIIGIILLMQWQWPIHMATISESYVIVYLVRGGDRRRIPQVTLVCLIKCAVQLPGTPNPFYMGTTDSTVSCCKNGKILNDHQRKVFYMTLYDVMVYEFGS